MSANIFNSTLKAIACKVLPLGVRRVLSRWFKEDRVVQQAVPASYGCEVIEVDFTSKLVQLCDSLPDTNS